MIEFDSRMYVKYLEWCLGIENYQKMAGIMKICIAYGYKSISNKYLLPTGLLHQGYHHHCLRLHQHPQPGVLPKFCFSLWADGTHGAILCDPGPFSYFSYARAELSQSLCFGKDPWAFTWSRSRPETIVWSSSQKSGVNWEFCSHK